MPSEEPQARSTAETSTETPAPPAAWQPLTFRGVAAFAQAKLGRLLLVQLLVALVVTGTITWFLSTHWFPSIRKAVRELPDIGAIRAGRLSTPRVATAPLVQTRYLSITVDAEDTHFGSSLGDLRMTFQKTNVAICTFAGCVARPYPNDVTIQFNRPELQSWWGAWQPMLFVFISLGILGALFVSWLALATLYLPVVWLSAYFKDRRLTVIGAWKLASAALLPGALLVAAGIVLYGLGWIDLLRLTSIWAAHIPLGWLFLACAPTRLPRVTANAVPNPFGSAKTEKQNPFTGPPA